MANSEDENFDFGDLNLPNDDLPPLDQPLDETDLPPAADLPAVEAPLDEILASETPVAEQPSDAKSEPSEPAAAESVEPLSKEPRDLSSVWEYGGLGLGVVVLLAIGWLHLVYFSTAIYVISVGLVGYGIWKGRRTNSIFTVFLACALLAVLTAVYCLWLELGRYQFEVKAKNARRAAVSQTFDVSRLV
ncbi:MAG: hypothetical protein ABFC77_12675 [Thermoguttaceae bacterium]